MILLLGRGLSTDDGLESYPGWCLPPVPPHVSILPQQGTCLSFTQNQNAQLSVPNANGTLSMSCQHPALHLSVSSPTPVPNIPEVSEIVAPRILVWQRRFSSQFPAAEVLKAG